MQSVKNGFRAFRPFSGRHNRVIEPTFQMVVKKFRTNLTLVDIKRTTSMCSDNHIDVESAIIEEDRNLSISCLLKQLEYSTTW